MPAKEQGDQLYGIIYRKFYGHSILVYVRPHLAIEYTVPVWDPYQQGHINSLEKSTKSLYQRLHRKVEYGLRQPELIK